MKKFQFSLEKVKNFREKEEKVLQKELIEAQKKAFIIQNKIDELDLHIAEESIKIQEITSKPHKSNDYLQLYNFMQNLTQEKSNKNKELILANASIEIARKKLLEKSIERKTLEKLKEMKELDYKNQLKKLEQSNLDEIAIRMAHFGVKK